MCVHIYYSIKFAGIDVYVNYTFLIISILWDNCAFVEFKSPQKCHAIL